MDPKKARRRARAALQKALLKAEQAKADEGLAACLPMMAALQVGWVEDTSSNEPSTMQKCMGWGGTGVVCLLHP